MLFKEQFLKYKRICLKVCRGICWKHMILLKIKCATDTRFFYKQQLYKQQQAEIGKKTQVNAKQHSESELLLFQNYSSSTRYHPMIIGRILRNNRKNKCVCFHEIKGFESRWMSVELKCYVKSVTAFYKFYDFFCRRHSLMNRPYYNNLFQFIPHSNFRNLNRVIFTHWVPT